MAGTAQARVDGGEEYQSAATVKSTSGAALFLLFFIFIFSPGF
jgi:hypothetical protein